MLHNFSYKQLQKCCASMPVGDGLALLSFIEAKQRNREADPLIDPASIGGPDWQDGIGESHAAALIDCRLFRKQKWTKSSGADLYRLAPHRSDFLLSLMAKRKNATLNT